MVPDIGLGIFDVVLALFLFLGFPPFLAMAICGTASGLLPRLSARNGFLLGIPLGIGNVFLGFYIAFGWLKPYTPLIPGDYFVWGMVVSYAIGAVLMCIVPVLAMVVLNRRRERE